MEYAYLSTILLICVAIYFWTLYIDNDDKYIKDYELNHNRIVIQTENDLINIKSDTLLVHLNGIKKTLLNLGQTVKVINPDEIAAYLVAGCDDLEHYAHLQNINIQHGDNMHAEKELVMRKLLDENNLRISSMTDRNSTIRLDNIILRCLINLETIILFIKYSVCKNGKLRLTNIHHVIDELYKEKCTTEKCPTPNDTKLVWALPLSKKHILPPALRRVSESIAVINADKSLNPYASPHRDGNANESEVYTRKSFDLADISGTSIRGGLSHSNNPYMDSSDADIIRKFAVVEQPKAYDIDELRQSHNEKNERTNDLKCSKSLRNDYDMLENICG